MKKKQDKKKRGRKFDDVWYEHDQQWEWVMENRKFIKGAWVEHGELETISRMMEECVCGSSMIEADYDPELDGDLTEGQFADAEAGFRRPFQCQKCGLRIWIKTADSGGLP